MKRRSFLKRSSIGLGAVVAGAAGAGRVFAGVESRGRIYGIPASVRSRPALEHDLARFSLARTDIPPELWQDVVALGLLAQDVFDNPEVARAFSRDPRGYLQTIGLDEVRLDPEAREVKVALALGDPEVRDAVERNDPKGFLRAIERRGLLTSPEPSRLAARLSGHLAAAQAALGPSPAPETCSTILVCAIWIYVTLIQDVAATVTATLLVSIYAYLLVYTKAVGSKKTQQIGTLPQSPSFRLATALGGEEFGAHAASAYLDESVETVAQAVEGLEAWSASPPMDGERLRTLVRAQMARTLGGSGVVVEAPRS